MCVCACVVCVCVCVWGGGGGGGGNRNRIKHEKPNLHDLNIVDRVRVMVLNATFNNISVISNIFDDMLI